MRLFVVALITFAFTQPVLAREHHQYSNHRVHSHRHLVHAQAWRTVAWRHPDAWTRGDFVAREGTWGRTMPDRDGASAQASEGHATLDTMIARHAQMNGVPEALVHRVVVRESRYHARVVGAGGAMGLMQIKLATAREMGYGGTAAGLLDPETNLTYAVRYLAGAYRVAGGNADRAVANYARGYRDATVRQGGAPGRTVASAETSGWTGSYASVVPVERVAWVGPYGRRQPMRWR